MEKSEMEKKPHPTYIRETYTIKHASWNVLSLSRDILFLGRSYVFTAQQHSRRRFSESALNFASFRDGKLAKN